MQQSGSSSLTQNAYWWHTARASLLEATFRKYISQPARVLDVGSADGPSVAWMHERNRCVSIDVVADGLTPGNGVCGSALALPFQDCAFEIVTAFDVLEHCQPESQALAEMARVLMAGGRLLLSVPAYQWAWTDHDVRSGHYRRYTKRRLVAAMQGAGLDVDHSTYAFSTVFPFFVAERLLRRLRPRDVSTPRLPVIPAPLEYALLAATRLDSRVLQNHNIPFGSSVFAAALKKAAR